MARDLVESLKHLSWRAAKEGLRRRGYDVVARTRESPIPDTAAIPAETWDPSERVGLDLRLDAAWALLEDELAPFIRRSNICCTRSSPSTMRARCCSRHTHSPPPTPTA